MGIIKKCTSVITIISFFLMAGVPAFADTTALSLPDEPVAEVTYLSDGSRVVTEIFVEPSLAATSQDILAAASSASTKSGSKKVSYENSSGTLLWYVKVSGTFTYNGSTSTCTKSTVSTSAPASNWKISSNDSGKTGNQAWATATAKRYNGSTVVQTVSRTVTLTCSKTGVLS
jgi:hypothetical protein